MTPEQLERQRKRHRDYMREYMKRPIPALKGQALKRAYYRANKEKFLEKSRDVRLADPERARAYKRKWNAAHREYWQSLRALKRNAPGRATDEQIRARVAFYGGKCWMCRANAGTTLDHVKPLVRGGSHWPSNLRPACKSCNASKGARWPLQEAS